MVLHHQKVPQPLLGQTCLYLALLPTPQIAWLAQDIIHFSIRSYLCLHVLSQTLRLARHLLDLDYLDSGISYLCGLAECKAMRAAQARSLGGCVGIRGHFDGILPQPVEGKLPKTGVSQPALLT